tara:strand:+ start:3224 stop:3640 length:417 start_codon:yes stop_codon:yes gene_type:complete
MIADRFLPLLSKVRSTGQGRWIACCPVHEDKTPSMTITESDESVLIHCFGCGANGKDVCEALGIDPFELFGRDFIAGEYKKPRIPAADILRCLDFEVMFLNCVQQQLAQGQPLTDKDKDRMKLTSKRIHSAMQAGGLR